MSPLLFFHVAADIGVQYHWFADLVILPLFLLPCQIRDIVQPMIEQ
jgi:hypothetical protein